MSTLGARRRIPPPFQASDFGAEHRPFYSKLYCLIKKVQRTVLYFPTFNKTIKGK
jgi:hypothetical protein